jgi:ribosome-binding factor A
MRTVWRHRAAVELPVECIVDAIARARLNSSLLETLAMLLERRVRDPRVQGVTLTSVQVANDLAVAKVYYSVLDGEEQRRIVQKGLENVAGFLRGEVGRILHIRNAPQLRFYFDASLQRGNRIESLLREIHDHDAQGSPAADSAAPDTPHPDEEK